MAIPFRLCLHRHQYPLPSTQHVSHHFVQFWLVKRRVIEDVVESSDHRFRGILELSIMQNGLCSSIKHDLRKIEMRFPLQDFLNNQSNLLGFTKWTTHGHTLPTIPPPTSMSFAFEIVHLIILCRFLSRSVSLKLSLKAAPADSEEFRSIPLYRTVGVVQSRTVCARLRCDYPYTIA